jgi:hypothetical protein
VKRNVAFLRLDPFEEKSLLTLAMFADMGVILSSKKDVVAFGFIAWMATIFAVYRYDIHLLSEPCNCAGVVQKAWYTKPQLLTAGLIVLSICGWGGLCSSILNTKTSKTSIA